jgi:hypothetical protein
MLAHLTSPVVDQFAYVIKRQMANVPSLEPLRVSTEEQANSGLGLEAQRECIQRYADAHGWDVI